MNDNNLNPIFVSITEKNTHKTIFSGNVFSQPTINNNHIIIEYRETENKDNEYFVTIKKTIIPIDKIIEIYIRNQTVKHEIKD